MKMRIVLLLAIALCAVSAQAGLVSKVTRFPLGSDDLYIQYRDAQTGAWLNEVYPELPIVWFSDRIITEALVVPHGADINFKREGSLKDGLGDYGHMDIKEVVLAKNGGGASNSSVRIKCGYWFNLYDLVKETRHTYSFDPTDGKPFLREGVMGLTDQSKFVGGVSDTETLIGGVHNRTPEGKAGGNLKIYVFHLPDSVPLTPQGIQAAAIQKWNAITMQAYASDDAASVPSSVTASAPPAKASQPKSPSVSDLVTVDEPYVGVDGVKRIKVTVQNDLPGDIRLKVDFGQALQNKTTKELVSGIDVPVLAGHRKDMDTWTFLYNENLTIKFGPLQGPITMYDAHGYVGEVSKW